MVHKIVLIHPPSRTSYVSWSRSKFFKQYKTSGDCTVAMHMFALFLVRSAFLRPDSHIWDS